MRYFDRSDFDCPCCGYNVTTESFLNKIDETRHLAGVAFIVNSGCRCPKHNKKVGGADNSAHLRCAIDIRCLNSRTRKKILKAVMYMGWRRVGIYKSFIHVDDDPKLPEAIWLG
ncbi:hypothetical protein A134_23075 [Vibrio crassostreae 9CS106]|uniref:Peptidase M15A C-terminal domain-containing protein n=1 Tax=Vibrio crassostreae 9CS106 TaxID=1191300 RepID=A0A1B1C3J3_9VIBR|nr:hypothetical protein A134_23075 [Vibrio crassostreae 9CS106]